MSDIESEEKYNLTDQNFNQAKVTEIKQQENPNAPKLQEIKIQFPIEKKSTFDSYMLYTITLNYGVEEKTISRRFQDIQALRSALFVRLPFSYLYPAHQKQLIVVLLGKQEQRVPGRENRRARPVLPIHSQQHRQVPVLSAY